MINVGMLLIIVTNYDFTLKDQNEGGVHMATYLPVNLIKTEYG